jgi:uncharacterized membrane protein
MKLLWFGFILMAFIVVSLCIPIVMLVQSRSAARRLFRRAMLVLLPTMAISLGAFGSEAEEDAFMGVWQALTMGTVLLAISLGLGYCASWVKAAWLARHPGAKPKVVEPEL